MSRASSGAMYQIQSQAQYVAVEAPDQCFKSQAVARLSFADQCLLFRKLSPPLPGAHRCRARRSSPWFYRPSVIALVRGTRPWSVNPAGSGISPACWFRKDRRRQWPLVSTGGRRFPTIGQCPKASPFKVSENLCQFVKPLFLRHLPLLHERYKQTLGPLFNMMQRGSQSDREPSRLSRNGDAYGNINQ